MRAVLTDEQRWLHETADALARRFQVNSPDELRKVDLVEVHEHLARAGLFGLRRRSDDGAPAASGVEAVLVAHALARELTPGAFLTSGLLSLELAELASADSAVLDGLAEGREVGTVLLDDSLLAPAPPGSGSVLEARRASVVLAVDGDGGVQLRRLDEHVELSSGGADLSRPTARLAAPPSGWQLVGATTPSDRQRWTALTLACVAADIVGAARGALDRAIDYSRSRHQFGVPIGSFQAVQHLCARAYAQLEGAWSTVKYAGWAADELPPAEALLAGRVAKAAAGRLARTVPEIAMQVYGGIGQTWENTTHLYLRRAATDHVLLGDDTYQYLEISRSRLGVE